MKKLSHYESMKKTRKLFILTGNHDYVSIALAELTFKGLITADFSHNTDENDLENAFKHNKCYVCAEVDFNGTIPNDAIRIAVYRTGISSDESHFSGPAIAIDLPDIGMQFEAIADSLNIDIGDHTSNSSGVMGSLNGHTQPHCFCCDHRDGKRSDNEPPLYKSPNFFVFPGSGQFANGYLQICPNRHVMSLGELPQEEIDEFSEVLEDIEYILHLTFNCSSTLVWENGSGASGIGKAKDSIVHSHVHIIPSNLTSDDVEEISNFNFETITLDKLSEYKTYSYLLIRKPDRNQWIINNDRKLYIPRQYIRQIVAAEYNIYGDLWNWRKYPFADMMKATSIVIAETLRKHWDELPERIKARCRNCIF
jgi:diadenosine tetraphosphate (Ap4A) HIT family hydrolase